MATQDRADVAPYRGYLLGVGQVVQALSLPVLVAASVLLPTEETSLVVASGALVLSVGNFVVLHQLQGVLFEDGTAEWRNWLR